jgi:hypothetical protein
LINQLRKEVAEIEARYIDDDKSMNALTETQMYAFENAEKCAVGNCIFSDQNCKVRHHNHFTGEFICAACNNCNLKIRKRPFVPVFFHNMSKYDAHLFISELNFDDKEIGIIPHNTETYISISKRIGKFELRFLDSLRFLQSSLENICEGLVLNDFVHMKRHFPNYEMLCRKGIFPYEYVDCVEKLDELQLPPQEAFFSSLTESGVSDSDYKYAQSIWETFKINTLGEYSDLYLKTDVLLLADAFENFRKVSMEHYNLDPSAFYTSPGFSWEAALKMTGVQLELISDVDILLFFENGIRGGICQSIHRYATANNKFIDGYTSNCGTADSYITYFDAVNLYGFGMCQKLPTGNFEWLDEENISKLENDLRENNCNINFGQSYSKSCILEVDLEYPQHLHDLHSSFPFCPQHLKPPLAGKPNKKLLCTLENKTKYILTFENLQQCLAHGLVLKKIYRCLQYDHSDWLKVYIMTNTNFRAQATTPFLKDHFKTMNNASFGKTMENVREHRDIRLVCNWNSARKLISKSSFKSCKVFSENLIAIENYKTEIMFNKPIYVGMAILELSKTLMYSFHYDYIMSPKIVSDFKVQLMYMDTDSLVYHFTAHNLNSPSIYDIIKRDAEEYFDTSVFSENNIHKIPCCNKKVVGKFKDEFANTPIKKFICLRAKAYALITNEGDSMKKAKGVGKAAIKRLNFADYENALFNHQTLMCSFNTIRTINHEIGTYNITKAALNACDDKRVIDEDGISTKPYYHYSLNM